MAKIKDLTQQKEALKTIEGLIDEIKSINEFLALDNPSGKYEISFSTKEPIIKDGVEKEKKKKHAAPFLCTDREIIKRYVGACKTERKNTITELAELYNIELDEEEKELLK